MSAGNDLRTPLARVRGLGSARSGTAHFWQMRLTSVARSHRSRASAWRMTGTIKPPAVCVAMPICTPPKRRMMSVSSS